MLRLTAKVMGLLILLLPARTASAQFLGPGSVIFPGSTVQGDILRGEGIFLEGAGLFNYYTAVGDSINADTWMRLNEYIYLSVKHSSMLNAKRRAEMIARNKKNYKEILDRILNHPEYYDLARGDALNALYEKLTDPEIAPSAFRLAPVHLSGETIRGIPFVYGPENATISLQRITARGKWPVGLRGAAFASERRAYERAVDNALEQQIEGVLSREAIRDVEVAVNDLSAALDREIAPSRDKVYLEARNYLRGLEAAKELFKLRTVEQILGEIDKYSGTTVQDLVEFMKRNNLRFGVPELGDERAMYPRLYASLRQQLDLVKFREANPNQ